MRLKVLVGDPVYRRVLRSVACQCTKPPDEINCASVLKVRASEPVIVVVDLMSLRAASTRHLKSGSELRYRTHPAGSGGPGHLSVRKFAEVRRQVSGKVLKAVNWWAA